MTMFGIRRVERAIDWRIIKSAAGQRADCHKPTLALIGRSANQSRDTIVKDAAGGAQTINIVLTAGIASAVSNRC